MLSRAASAMRAAAPVALGAGLMGGIALSSDDALAPPEYPWEHTRAFTTYNAANLRRGFEVYSQVCATCHSLNLIAYRNFVGTFYTEEEAKVLAGRVEVVDGPGDDGEMFERPGKLSDSLPAPYQNEQQARSINNGAFPPDLSLMIKARHGREDYLFALLTGYRDPPAGVVCGEGQYYNAYFPGGKIGMPKQLVDGGVEYTDGTPATESQMAKDVCEFLAWAAEPEADERKRIALKWMLFISAMTLSAGYYKRFRWSSLKTRKITYIK